MSHDLPLALLRLVCGCTLLLSLPASAGVYKCAGDKGGVVYQDSACVEGKELRNLEAEPATLSVVPGTPVPRAAARASAGNAAHEPKPGRIRTVTVKSTGGNPAERKFVRTGMTEAEVVHRIGRPDMQLNSRRKEGKQWSYLPTAGDADTLTTVTFNGGAVVRVERRVVR